MHKYAIKRNKWESIDKLKLGVPIGKKYDLQTKNPVWKCYLWTVQAPSSYNRGDPISWLHDDHGCNLSKCQFLNLPPKEIL